MYVFHSELFKHDLNKKIEETSVRRVAELTEGKMSYSKVWRLANIDSIVGILDYLILCEVLEQSANRYIEYV